ncbi:UNVERIFIED_CONTAM: hypothetical protein HDU68_005502, partial [Siphonaria sp. JEL0065]
SRRSSSILLFLKAVSTTDVRTLLESLRGVVKITGLPEARTCGFSRNAFSMVSSFLLAPNRWFTVVPLMLETMVD